MKRLIILLLALSLAAIHSWADGPVTKAGKVTIDGPKVIVPITVTGFNQIGAISLKLNYDPAVISYTGISVPSGSPVAVSANAVLSGSPTVGTVIMSWYCNLKDLPQGISLTDESVLLNIEFDVISHCTSLLTWNDDDFGNGCEYMDASTQQPFHDIPATDHYIGGYVSGLIVQISTGNPDFFNGGVTLTANTSVPGDSYVYEWSGPDNGLFSTSSSITLTDSDLPGVYQVQVTGTNACGGIASASYDYQPQNHFNSYTILGFSKVMLSERNFVLSGSVGCTGSTGRVVIGKNSTVNGPGGFVRASTITVGPFSLVPIRIMEPAIVQLPEMQFNTSTTAGLANLQVPNNTTRTYSGNYQDVNIGSGCRVTFSTGTVFGKVNIGKSSQVTFRTNHLNVRRLDLADGSDAAPTMLLFESDAAVKVIEQVTIGRSAKVNPTGASKVVFFIGSNGPSYEFRVKPGGNVTVNASVYAPFGSIIVEGNQGKNTFMNGQFIADEVFSNDKNIYWNSTGVPFIGTNSSPVKSLDLTKSPDDPSLTPALSLVAYPNPASGKVTLEFSVQESAPASINMYSSTGQLIGQVYRGFVENAGKKSVIMDNHLANGLYFIELRSNQQVRIVRLLIADKN